MPRDANGNYTLPPGNPVVTDTLIETNWANSTMPDLGSELTDSLSRSGKGGMLAPFRNADGTVAAPGITWNNEPTTGMFRSATGVIGISISATEIAQWNSAGLVLSAGKELTTGGLIRANEGLLVPDSKVLGVGNDNDVQILHDGTNSYIRNITGVFRLRADDLRFTNSAQSTQYAQFDSNGTFWINTTTDPTGTGTEGTSLIAKEGVIFTQTDPAFAVPPPNYKGGLNVYINQNLTGNSSGIIRLGDNAFVYEIDAGTAAASHLAFATGDTNAVAERLRITAAGTIDAISAINANGGVKSPDNTGYYTGTGDDLRIYHDGTNSRAINNTGIFFLQGAQITLQNAAGTENLASFLAGGSSSLRHSNVERFRTASDGAVLTGTMRITENIAMLGAVGLIRKNSANGADNEYIEINGGGGAGNARGGYIRLFGNENTGNEGSVYILGGNGTIKGSVQFYTASAFRGGIYEDGSWRIGTAADGLITSSEILSVDGIASIKASSTHPLSVWRANAPVDNMTFMQFYSDVSSNSRGGIRIAGTNGLALDGNDRTDLRVGSVAKFTARASYNESLQNLRFGNNVRAEWGNSQELQIYYDGAFSFIKNSAASGLYLDSDSLQLRASSGQPYFIGTAAGSVELFYANSKKFETASTGNIAQGQFESKNTASTAPIKSNNTRAGATTAADVLHLRHDASSSDLSVRYTGTAEFWQIRSEIGTGGALIASIEDSRWGLRAWWETTETDSASGATKTIDCREGSVFDVTLTANCTFTFSNPAPSGQTTSFTLLLKQDATGSRTATWPASVKWANGTEPSISAGPSEEDVFTFFTKDGGTTWYGFLGGVAFA